jgi:ABC-2 type transport system ATP-binding protein
VSGETCVPSTRWTSTWIAVSASPTSVRTVPASRRRSASLRGSSTRARARRPCSVWFRGAIVAGSTFELHARIYGIERATFIRRRDELLDLFDAAELADQQPRSMSLGQRMRCELIASLLHDPGILFLDEPTIGLDLIAKRTLRDLVVRLNEQRGTTLLLTSHDVADIETVADRVVIIDHGRCIFDGTVDELRREFLRSKLIEVQFGDDLPPPVAVAGCELLVAESARLSIRVDLDARRLGDVLDELVAGRVVDDMTVSDPPLEDVIGHIYVRGRP